MALKDRLGDRYLEKVHQRWREDINADVFDIVLELREAEMKDVERKV